MVLFRVATCLVAVAVLSSCTSTPKPSNSTPVVVYQLHPAALPLPSSVVVQGDALACSDSLWEPLALEIEGATDYQGHTISTKHNNKGVLVITANDGLYPASEAMIVNNATAVFLPEGFSTGAKSAAAPKIELNPKEFGGVIDSAVFCARK